MIPHLDKLNKYHYYFQFTLNAYLQDIETGLPGKSELLETFRQLSLRLGPHRVIWRYDPVLLNEKYTIAYHVDCFAQMALALKGYTEKVTISFIDLYSKTKRIMSELNIQEINTEDKQEIAKQFAGIAHENSLLIDTCAEDIELSPYGIQHARCIDGDLIEKITGHSLNAKKDASQRPECGCIASVDIGAYNSCPHGCLYCYANCNRAAAIKNMHNHDKLSPVLVGEYRV